jgi:hypothetical protein
MSHAYIREEMPMPSMMTAITSLTSISTRLRDSLHSRRSSDAEERRERNHRLQQPPALTDTLLAALATEPGLDQFVSRNQAQWMAQRILDLQGVIRDLEREVAEDPADRAL